nr:YceI family protein [Mycobacterium genavense]
MSVVVTAVQPTVGNATELHASFTIKGVTAPVLVTLTGSSTGDGSIQISGETTIDPGSTSARTSSA